VRPGRARGSTRQRRSTGAFAPGYVRVSFTFSVVKNSITSPGFTSL